MFLSLVVVRLVIFCNGKYLFNWKIPAFCNSILVGCGIAHTTNIRLDRAFVKLGFGGGVFPDSLWWFKPWLQIAAQIFIPNNPLLVCFGDCIHWIFLTLYFIISVILHLGQIFQIFQFCWNIFVPPVFSMLLRRAFRFPVCVSTGFWRRLHWLEFLLVLAAQVSYGDTLPRTGSWSWEGGLQIIWGNIRETSEKYVKEIRKVRNHQFQLNITCFRNYQKINSILFEHRYIQSVQ